MAKNLKTRPVKSRSDWTCPVHGVEVTTKVRKTIDEKGKSSFSGTYYGCPEYSECGYYVSGGMRVPTSEALAKRL